VSTGQEHHSTQGACSHMHMSAAMVTKIELAKKRGSHKSRLQREMPSLTRPTHTRCVSLYGTQNPALQIRHPADIAWADTCRDLCSAPLHHHHHKPRCTSKQAWHSWKQPPHAASHCRHCTTSHVARANRHGTHGNSHHMQPHTAAIALTYSCPKNMHAIQGDTHAPAGSC